MTKSRFLIAPFAAACMLFATASGVAAQGVGGLGGGTGGGVTGGGSGFGGSGGGGGNTMGWGGTCGGANKALVGWNSLVFGQSITGAQIDANLYNPQSNPTGTVYVYPVTPWGGAMPGAATGYKDQNGNKYYPWWACVPKGSFTNGTPPGFTGFSTYAAAVTSTGSLTIDKPTCGNAICQFFVVFDTVEVSANLCGAATPWGTLTPMVVPGGYPVSNTGTAYYSNVAGCPQSVTVAGIDTSNTWKYKYTLQWKEIPICQGQSYQYNWGDGSPLTCQGRIAQHAYPHVYPQGPVTPGSGASISAKQNWYPVCTGIVTNIATGAMSVNSPTPGSYACTGTAVLTQDIGPTAPHPILQIETLPVS